MIHKEEYDMNYIKAKKLLLKHYKKKVKAKSTSSPRA